MALQEYIGEISITNSTKDFTVNNGTGYAIELTTGDYFAEGYSGESADQLIEHVQTKIRAANAAFDVAGANECTVSRSSGLVVMAFAAGGGNVSVTWDDAALGTLLGFTSGNLSGAYTYTADVTPKGVWRPTRALTKLGAPGNENAWWGKRSTSKMTISRDGSNYGMVGNLLYEGLYVYESLTLAETKDSSTSQWTTFESLWETVVHNTQPIRVLPDRDSYTSTTYKTGYILPADAESDGAAIAIGALDQYGEETVAQYNGLYDVRFKMAKEVTAS